MVVMDKAKCLRQSPHWHRSNNKMPFNELVGGSSLFLCRPALQSPIEYQRRESKSNSLGRSMRPPLSAASALRPHSSASIDRHKLPSLHSHNTSLPALYLPSQGQGQGPSETNSLRDVSFLVTLWAWHPATLSNSTYPFEHSIPIHETPQTVPGLLTAEAFFWPWLWIVAQIKKHHILLHACVHDSFWEWPTCCLLLQPAAVRQCPADSHTVSPSHVQLGFTDQPNCQAVSNGLYTPATQSAQVVYMHTLGDKAVNMGASALLVPV